MGWAAKPQMPLPLTLWRTKNQKRSRKKQKLIDLKLFKLFFFALLQLNYLKHINGLFTIRLSKYLDSRDLRLGPRRSCHRRHRPSRLDLGLVRLCPGWGICFFDFGLVSPCKKTWLAGKSPFFLIGYIYIFLNGCFSIVMLVFGGVVFAVEIMDQNWIHSGSKCWGNLNWKSLYILDLWIYFAVRIMIEKVTKKTNKSWGSWGFGGMIQKRLLKLRSNLPRYLQMRR